MTEYARRNPRAGDLAESALFVFAYLNDPTALPREIRVWLEDNIPARIEFLRDVLTRE